MQLARVIGDVVSSHKDPSLVSMKLLVIQPIGPDGADTGKTLVALDAAGAGVGERVFFVRGREAAFPFYPLEPSTDASIIGIVDHWSIEPSAETSAPGSERRTSGRRS
jgi:microcompartment protein CcmK/EutM